MENILVQQHSTNPDDPQGTDRRLAMLARNRELAEHWVSTLADDHIDVVVLLLDLDGYAVSKAIAQATALGQPNRWNTKLIGEVKDEGNIPTGIVGMGRWSGYKMLRSLQAVLHLQDPRDPKESPVVESLRHSAPQGTFYCLAISRGKQLATYPIL